MSQPHPPIPEPQPHPDHDVAPPAPDEIDEPRTQSILLPPSQRQAEEPAQAPAQPVDAPPAEPSQDWTPPPSAPPSTAPPSAEQPLNGQPLNGQPAPPPATSQFAAPPTPGPATGQFAQPAYQPSYDPGPTQVTGPVDFVPGFGSEPPPGVPGTGSHAAPPPSPGPSTAPGSLPASPPSGPPPSTQRRSPLAAVQRARRGRGALLPLGLGVLGLVVLELGLARDFGSQSLWEVVPTWSVLATVAALAVLAPAVAGLTGRFPARAAWRAGAVGVATLAAFWVLIALPIAASDRGFWLTAALAAAAAALWLAPGRPE